MVRTFTTILKTPHAKCLLVLQAPYKQLIYKIYTDNKLTLLTDQNWPVMTNLYLSLTASNMTAKLTN